MNLAEILYWKFPNVDFTKDVILQDDGNGVYIKKWDESLGEQPTQEILDQWALELEPEKYIVDQRENRRNSYPAIGDQLDALLKYLETKEDLTPEITAIVEQWRAIKLAYPLEQQ